MSPDTVAMILSRLVFGAVATFLAIMVWSKTRDSAWMFVVIGTIVAYGDAVFTALEAFGLARIDVFMVMGVSVIRLLFANLPMLLYAIAFLIVIVRRSPRRSSLPRSQFVGRNQPQIEAPVAGSDAEPEDAPDGK
jgi:hypothetical protein